MDQTSIHLVPNRPPSSSELASLVGSAPSGSSSLFFLSISALLLLSFSVSPLLADDPSCPTIGTAAYLLVTVSADLDLTGFIGLLSFYSKLMPRNETITYNFYFGVNYTTTVVVNNIQEEIEDWVHDQTYIEQLFAYATVDSAATVQYDDNSTKTLSGVVRNIFNLISTANQQPATVIRKKQVVLLTDYVQVNVTAAMNADNNENEQKFGLFHDLNITQFDVAADFPVFSVTDEMDIDTLRIQFQEDLPFQFPSVREDKPGSSNFILMTSFDSSVIIRLAQSAMVGDMCTMAVTKMYRDFIGVQYARNGTTSKMRLPWLGDQTDKFLTNCIHRLPPTISNDTSCSAAASSVVLSFFSLALSQSNSTFLTLFAPNMSCVMHNVTLKDTLRNSTHLRLVGRVPLDSLYEPVILPLKDLSYLTSYKDNQVIYDSSYYLSNYTTTCVSKMPFVPLIAATPYHRPKHLSIALDDMLWITVCATISVVVFGTILYTHIKRKQKKQQELLNEIMLQPRVFKPAPESAEMARLPWEIKPDRVSIDHSYMLGEGTVSNVYLGKLKGKAPIMQWLDRVDLKQYQDCPVAVRVPRHFDEPEEDQLTREIASMRRLRYHDHIALLLGWTKKNDLVCSLLELTHMNLVKYSIQIRETIATSSDGTTAPLRKYVPYQVLYKIIWEICDGMSYVHSRRLVHRDLTARNILLTAGLSAKISGFGFCSEPDDPKFSANAPALRFLPMRWLAPECFQGKFSPSSDIWSFGILLYEMFTLGELPYEDLHTPEDIVETVRKGRIPAMPKYATKQIYRVMQECYQQFPTRRPVFNHLKEVFMAETEAFYDNAAFDRDTFE